MKLPFSSASGTDLLALLFPRVKEALDARKERERLKKEEEAATRRSALIDEELKAQRIRDRKERQSSFRMLLVGSPGSGKSTTVKYFRMIYDKERWEAERLSWRAIILLNAVQSLIHVLELLEVSSANPSLTNDFNISVNDSPAAEENIASAVNDLSNDGAVDDRALADGKDVFSDSSIQESEDMAAQPDGGGLPEHLTLPKHQRDSFVRHLESLRSLDADLKDMIRVASQFDRRPVSRNLPRPSSGSWPKWDPTLTISDSTALRFNSCRENFLSLLDSLASLWTSSIDEGIVPKARTEFKHVYAGQEDEFRRIADPEYQPSNIDILRADFRNVGLVEDPIPRTSIAFPSAFASHESHFTFYDMGGPLETVKVGRWAPLVDDLVDNLAFHFPLPIGESRSQGIGQNDIQKSMALWQSICASTLLWKIHFTVFFTKVDLLERYLKSGVAIESHLLGYGDENKVEDAISHWRTEFRNVANKSDYRPARAIHFHALNMENVASAKQNLERLRDDIVRRNIRSVHEAW